MLEYLGNPLFNGFLRNKIRIRATSRIAFQDICEIRLLLQSLQSSSTIFLPYCVDIFAEIYADVANPQNVQHF